MSKLLNFTIKFTVSSLILFRVDGMNVLKGGLHDSYFEPSSLGEKELAHFEPFLTHFIKLMEAYQSEA